MAQERGSDTECRMYEEVTYGTIEASPPGLKLPYIDSSLALSQDLIESRVLTGTREAPEPVLNEKTVQGSITIQPDVNSFPFILKHFIGAPVTTGAGPYVHTHKVLALPVGLDFELWYPNIPISARYSGCRINGMSINVTPGGLLEVTLDIIGQDEDITVATELDASPTSYSVKAFRLPAITFSEGGSGFTTATGFSMNLSNELEPVRTIGNGGKIAILPEGIFRASGSMSVLFDSMTMYNKAKNATESELEILFDAPTASEDVTFHFEEVRYAVSSPTVNGQGAIQADMNWQAFFDDGSNGSSCQVVVNNAIASYAAIP